MTKLMRIEEYIETRYSPRSRPSKRTVVKLITEGQIPGKRLGRFYYVNIAAEELLTGNSLVDSVLMASSR